MGLAQATTWARARDQSRLWRDGLALVLLCLVIAQAAFSERASAATLKADYQFQDTRASSIGGAPALTDLVGPGGPNVFVTETVNGLPRRVLRFQRGSGVAMPSARSLLPSGTYSIVMLVRLAERYTGYRRYLDFSDGTSDNGVYDRLGQLLVWNAGWVTTSTSARMRENTYEQVTITRDAAETVAGYIGAAAAFSPYNASTTGAARLVSDSLRFFQDPRAGTSGEDSAGAVARIRVYEGALTAAEVAALAPTSPPTQPPLDSDGDRIPDSGDRCPTVPAPTPDGCPSSAPSPPPPPVLGRVVNIAPVKGEVFVSVPAGAAAASASVPGLKGRRFVPLSQARQVPVGSILDVRKGTVRMTTASATPGKTQSSDFLSGVFQVLQARTRSAKGLTELRLKGSSFRACGRKGNQSSTRAQAARRSRRTIRRLRGNGSGRFRTRGRYSSATVRGTDWTVLDRCDGTLTKVSRGKVAVRDFRRRKTVLVRAGKSYLARPRR